MQAKKDNSSYEQIWEASGEAAKPAQREAYRRMVENPDKSDRKAPRPWEITAQQLRDNPFNPTNSATLAVDQAKIDTAISPQDAYETFAENSDSQGRMVEYFEEKDKTGKKRKGWRDWNPIHLDPALFKTKLKNMQRMVHDFPELKGKIGNMTEQTGLTTAMSAGSTQGGTKAADLTFQTSTQGMGFWSRMKRSLFNWGNEKFGVTTTNMDYTANHEPGHVLNSIVLNPRNAEDADNDWANNKTADKLIQRAFKRILPAEEYNNLKRYKKTNKDKNQIAGQLDLKGNKLFKKGHTSWYGQTDAGEFFAEAFADVYAHGEDARPVSIALVQEYEKYRDDLKEQKPVENIDKLPDDDLPGEGLNDSMIAISLRPKKKRKGK